MIQWIFDSAIGAIKRVLKKKLGIGTVAMVMSRNATAEGEDEPVRTYPWISPNSSMSEP